MYTIIETPVYLRQADALLEDDERDSIAAYLAMKPNAGSVIRSSGGIRKLRWRAADGGKRGGFQVIYFNRLEQGQIWLLTVFSKRQHEIISTRELAKVRKAMNHDH